MMEKLKSGIHCHKYGAIYAKLEQGARIRVYGSYRPYRLPGGEVKGFTKIAPIQLWTWNNENTAVPK